MGRSQSELLDGVPPMGRGRAAIGYRLEARGERREPTLSLRINPLCNNRLNEVR